MPVRSGAIKRRIFLLVLALAGGLALFLALRSRPVDTRFSGAYRFPDGHIVGISPTGEDTWRVRDFANGAVHSLYPEGEDLFAVGTGWGPKAAAEGTVRLTDKGLTWTRAGREISAARRQTSIWNRRSWAATKPCAKKRSSWVSA